MKNLLFIPLMLVLCFSCGSDDDATPESMGTMTVEKDGVSFTVTETNNTLVADSQGDQTGKRLDIRCTIEGGTFFVSVSNWDWQNPPENGIVLKSYDTNVDGMGTNTECLDAGNISFCDGGLGTYQVGTLIESSESTDDETPGIITITANDPTNKTVSGSFDFKTYEFFGGSETSWKGTFQNLVYR